MIQGGLYNYLTTAPSIVALLTAGQAGNSVHFVRAPKDPVTPFIVVHLPDVPPAESTFDGPSALVEGLVQFDCYASEVNGAVNARQLCQAVQALLAGQVITLNDGTKIAFVDVLANFDDNYEEGGTSFLFRSVVRFKAFYTEG